MIRDLNIFATVSRSLTLTDRSIEVTDENSAQFLVSLEPPKRFSGSEGSPRERDPFIMRWRSGLLGPGVAGPRAGYRVYVIRPGASYLHENGVTYELLSDPQQIRLGSNVSGMEVPVMAVIDLYPYEAMLKEQDGTEVDPVGVALWSNREDHETTGTYESFSGEAPVEFSSELGNNRWLDIGGDRYRVTSSITDFEGPRVKFNAIRANA